MFNAIDRGNVGMVEEASTSASRWKRDMRSGSRAKLAGRTFKATSRFSLVSRAR
jgi:hypothetical protein